MRVVVLAATSIVNAIYRAIVLEELRLLGHDVTVDYDAAAVAGGRIRASDLDVLHIHRYTDPLTYRAAARLREEGVAIVWDNDDDMTGSPLMARGGMRSQQEQRRARVMLELADLVTAPNVVLAEQFAGLGARETRVIENYLPAIFAAERAPSNGTVTVGWIAAGEHYHDLTELGLRDTFARLLDAHERLRFVSIGVKLGLPADRCRHVALAQYEDLARHVGTFDIGIAPIADIPFNRARSNVKLKEYAAVGVPWLASPIGPYAGLGENQGGRLVPDDGWFEALDRLVGDERGRRKLAKRARKWGERERARRNARVWEAALRRALEQAAARSTSGGAPRCA